MRYYMPFKFGSSLQRLDLTARGRRGVAQSRDDSLDVQFFVPTDLPAPGGQSSWHQLLTAPAADGTETVLYPPNLTESKKTGDPCIGSLG